MRLAIVIPTLNERPHVDAVVAQALAAADEVVVADGGSSDGTAQRAAELGARVVAGPPGRGRQLNLGVRATTAEALLFLHADTRLPDGAGPLACEALAGGAAGGGFRLRFDVERGILVLGGRLANLRSRLTGCPLGDQAQFASRAAFDAVGGFRDWPLLEDLDFIRRLKRYGRTVLLEPPVITAARRFHDQGIARTVGLNYLIWLLYFAGVSPHRLARLYRQIR
ncbi:MAG: glycosyltransferase [Acidobacteria bacterium]|nr:MAG: glycosyltransferase [Acidobacteriota bacterium]